jgi:UTP--glucose-1-phosphate uridylyltransferase
MTKSLEKAELFKEKMEREGLPRQVIDAFLRHYAALQSGNTGLIMESEIIPISAGALPESGSLSRFANAGEQALGQTVIIKLNGGLGTSMGLDGPKCLLPVKDGLTFFDITARQVLHLNQRYSCAIPLILMTSFTTHEKTGSLLDGYPGLLTSLPARFLQHKYPKVVQADLLPARWPANPAFEWNPPGHGDVYTALVTSGTLQALLDAGKTYALISNIDNLGATLDMSLLGYFAEKQLPFMMETARRGPQDKKGGHIARQTTGHNLILREQAQVSEEERQIFEDITRHRYFNTNTIWLNLRALDALSDHSRRPLDLPLIANKKTLVPGDPATPPVYQLETAMGAAISLFPGAEAVVVAPERFRPVKKFENLVVVWSDTFMLTGEYSLIRNPLRAAPPAAVKLDERYYSTYTGVMERFPHGVPSLLRCDSLTVEGDVTFGREITILGTVTIRNKAARRVYIPDGLQIDKDMNF